MDLRKVSDDGKTVVLEHDPVANAVGFRLSPVVKSGAVQSGKFAHTWDGTRTQHRFASGFAPYRVEALLAGDVGVWTGDPIPPPGGDPTAFGYRPDLPDGWTLVENKVFADADYEGKSKIMFRNCRGNFWNNDNNTSDIILVDCDLRGFQIGTRGKRISFYGCWFGDVTDIDGAQVKPLTAGGPRPEDWVFQGCSFIDVLRSSGSGKHTDGIQFGGIDGVVVRHCYFDNITIETILLNDWNGTPENALIEKSYFGRRISPGGPHIHIAGGAVNCHAIDNFVLNASGVASIQAGCVNCSTSGTRPSTEWPHGHPTKQDRTKLGY